MADDNKFIVFGQPLIEEEEINEVVDSLKKAWLGTGPKVHQFETDFARYKDMPYAAALFSCTAGLHLACVALGLKEGDEVITVANTFCATVNAIIHSGATPVLADINPETLNIDPAEIEKENYFENESHHSGAFRRPAVRDGCDHGDREGASFICDRRLRSCD